MEKQIEKLKIHLPGEKETKLEQLESQLRLVRKLAKEYERINNVKINLKVQAPKEGSFDITYIFETIKGFLDVALPFGSFILSYLMFKRDSVKEEKIKVVKIDEVNIVINNTIVVNKDVVEAAENNPNMDKDVSDMFKNIKKENRNEFKITTEDDKGEKKELVIKNEEFKYLTQKNPYHDIDRDIINESHVDFKFKSIYFKGDSQWEIILSDDRTLKVKIMDENFKKAIQQKGENANSKKVYKGKLKIIYENVGDYKLIKVKESQLSDIQFKYMIQ